MKCIIGLGNPGGEYEKTRHNAGFFMIDLLQHVGEFSDFSPSKFKGLVSEGMWKGEKVLLIKPITFMNLSGECVIPLLNFYKLDPRKDLLVISDDIDLDFGVVRYRTKGSAGGQNGLKSIIGGLGNDEFARIKIGIGRDPRYNVSDWVLSQFKKEELNELSEKVFLLVDEKVSEWVTATY